MAGSIELSTTDEEKRGILDDDLSQTEAVGFSKISQIWRNALALEIGLMFLYGAYLSLQQLQSSLFAKAGMGTTVFAIVYGGQVIFTMLVATPLIEILGAKRTILLSMVSYNLFTAAYFHPGWELFIPAALIMGLSSGIYVAQLYYVNMIAHDYAHLKGISNHAAASLFYGLSGSIYRAAPIWGNLISSRVLTSSNFTLTIKSVSDVELSLCGKDFCPENAANNTYLQGPSKDQLYTLAGIYMGCSLLGVIIILVFLQQLPCEKDKKVVCSTEAWQLDKVFSTLAMLKDYRILLLIPLTILGGMMRATFFADYSEAFITCPLGSWWVGYIGMCYSAVDGVGSILLGKFAEYVERYAMFTLVFVVNTSALLPLLFYQVSTENKYIYFIFAGLFGLADSLLSVQVDALYGVLFKENGQSAIAINVFSRLSGFIISFALQNHLCMPTKVYILLSILVIGFVGYITIEIMEKRKSKEL